MELRPLRSFLVLAEELHFGRAARRLHISQPPLSRQIRRLEDELGAELLRRTRRSVQLTDAGRLLVEQGRPLVDQAERVEELVRRAGAGEVGRLAVGFVGSATYETLPAIVRAFRDLAPGVELRLEELTTAPQVAALREGRIDVGLVRPPVAGGRLRLTPLVEERLVAALPDTHPLAGRRRVRAAALADDPFVLFPRQIGSGLYDDVLGVCRAAGFGPRVVQEAGDMQTIVSLVSAGIGVSLVPSSVAVFRPPGVVYRDLEGPNATLALALAERLGERSPLVARFREAARAAMRGGRA